MSRKGQVGRSLGVYSLPEWNRTTSVPYNQFQEVVVCLLIVVIALHMCEYAVMLYGLYVEPSNYNSLTISHENTINLFIHIESSSHWIQGGI